VTDRIELTDVQWRRVSPKYVWVDVIGNVITAIVMVGGASIAAWFIGATWLWAVPIALGVIFVLTIAFTPRRVRAIGYQLRADDLLFRKGLLFQRVVAVPYGRMQLVDINRGPIARALGLSELKFVTAAAATNITLPGIAEADAEQLRDELVTLAESRRAGL
jgi:uncharacterized protein